MSKKDSREYRINKLPIGFIKLLKKYRKDFDEDVLPEIRKRQYYLPPGQKRRAKDKKAAARRRKEKKIQT